MNKLKKSLLPFLLLMMGVIGFSSCSDDNDNKKPEVITQITLDKASQALTVGESFTLKAELTPAKAEDAITWSSDKTEVATVSDKGEVNAIAAGEATITASLKNGNKATCKVTVSAKEEKEEEVPSVEATVRFKKETYSIKYQETLDLTNEVELMNGTDDDLKFVWKSSDNNTLSISEEGIATGKDIGNVTVEVSLPNGNSASCTIEVTSDNDDNDDDNDESNNNIVTVNPWRVTIKEGQTYQLTINYNGINKENVVLKSSDEDIVTITQEGLITGVQEGSAQIIIEVNGRAQHNSCQVTVNPTIEEGRFTYVIRHVKKNRLEIISDKVVGDDKTINDTYRSSASATGNECFVYLDITDTKTNEVIKDFATKWEIVELDEEGTPSATTGFTGSISWWGETKFGLKIKSDKYGIDETITVIITEE